MSTHTPHEATLDVGLVDGCERCAEHARDPFTSLDQEHVAAFWRQMVEVENDRARYRSALDAQVGRYFARLRWFLLTYVPTVNPDVWPPVPVGSPTPLQRLSDAEHEAARAAIDLRK